MTGTTHGETALAAETSAAKVNSFDPTVAGDILAQFIFSTDLPIRFGEHPAFQKYMKLYLFLEIQLGVI